MVLCSFNNAGEGLSGTITVEVDALGRAVLEVCNTSTNPAAFIGFICFDVLNQDAFAITVAASTIPVQSITRDANCGGGAPPAPGSPCDQNFEVRLNVNPGGIPAPVPPATENCRTITLQTTNPNGFTESDFFLQNTGLHFQGIANTVCVGGVFDCCPGETKRKQKRSRKQKQLQKQKR